MDGIRRLEKFRNVMSNKNIDAALITVLPDIRYLTNFSGSSGLLVMKMDSAHLFTDFRYKEQASQEVFKSVEIHITNNLFGEAIRILKDSKAVGFESGAISHSRYLELRRKLRKRKFVDITNEVLKLRAVKEPEEIEFIKKAQAITDRIFKEVLELIEPGKTTELELAAEIEYRMKKYGASGPSFPTIVASGPHSALPHAQPRDVKIGINVPLIMDFGCFYKGYASDMTRTVWIGSNIDPKFKEIYEIVLEAQLKAIESIEPGKSTKSIDGVARNYIKEKGYGEYFGHGLGHGVGLEIHESPTLSFRSLEVLKEDMVVTVEPGIYLPGFGGVRIEDLVVVGKEPFIITKSPKELIKIG